MSKTTDRLKETFGGHRDDDGDPDSTAAWAEQLAADDTTIPPEETPTPPPPADQPVDQPPGPGTALAQTDARSERALAVARDFVGMVEIGAYASAYPRHVDHVLELAELISQARAQLGPPNRDLVDQDLRDRIRAAAESFANAS